MVNSNTTYGLDQDLTTFKVTGNLTDADLFDCLTHYFGGKVTLRTLRDITKATVLDATVDEIGNPARYARNPSGARLGGKTAIISNDDLGYGMTRMIGTLYELEHVPFEVQVFRCLGEAKAWIGIGGTLDC